ncbi:MAG: hypothetical protein ABSG94_12525 [Brevinematales bacterium]|jgi:hypothetical protein
MSINVILTFDLDTEDEPNYTEISEHLAEIDLLKEIEEGPLPDNTYMGIFDGYESSDVLKPIIIRKIKRVFDNLRLEPSKILIAPCVRIVVA